MRNGIVDNHYENVDLFLLGGKHRVPFHVLISRDKFSRELKERKEKKRFGQN